MKKEKHKWEKEKRYVIEFGNFKYHFVEEIEVCSDCGMVKC